MLFPEKRRILIDFAMGCCSLECRSDEQADAKSLCSKTRALTPPGSFPSRVTVHSHTAKGQSMGILAAHHSREALRAVYVALYKNLPQ